MCRLDGHAVPLRIIHLPSALYIEARHASRRLVFRAHCGTVCGEMIEKCTLWIHPSPLSFSMLSTYLYSPPVCAAVGAVQNPCTSPKPMFSERSASVVYFTTPILRLWALLTNRCAINHGIPQTLMDAMHCAKVHRLSCPSPPSPPYHLQRLCRDRCFSTIAV